MNLWIGSGMIAIFTMGFLGGVVRGVSVSVFSIIIIILLYMSGLSYIYYHYTRPEKYLVLNRLEGLITIPNTLYFKPCTMAFSDSLAAWSMKNSGINASPPSLSVFYPNGFSSRDVIGYDVVGDWSFMVWYIDKNRPLPLGSAFDDFRVQDYERRKSEGFPKPLYPSYITAPEVTLEQQADRERIGGW